MLNFWQFTCKVLTFFLSRRFGLFRERDIERVNIWHSKLNFLIIIRPQKHLMYEGYAIILKEAKNTQEWFVCVSIYIYIYIYIYICNICKENGSWLVPIDFRLPILMYLYNYLTPPPPPNKKKCKKAEKFSEI